MWQNLGESGRVWEHRGEPENLGESGRNCENLGESARASSPRALRARNSVGKSWGRAGKELGESWAGAGQELGASLGPIWKAKLSILAEEYTKKEKPVVAWNGKRS